ncbi:hypothetical protein ACHAXT_002000 [Thalassiosira profunda]
MICPLGSFQPTPASTQAQHCSIRSSIMSVPDVDRPPCSICTTPNAPPRRKRVRFSAEVDDVRLVSHKYPSDYFYTRSEMARFRDEVREERRGSADSPVQRAFNVASSSAILVVFLIVGLIAATIACLPLLLALKISSAVFSCAAHHDGVDSSVLPYSPSTGLEYSSMPERLIVSLLGGQYEKQVVAPLLSN